MIKIKFTFNDIKIGDIVLTTNNKIGEVIALKSYAYLNDKFEKKSKKPEEIDSTFKFDSTRHQGIWYSAVTIAIEDKDANVPTYYTESIDLIEIKKILQDEKTIKITWLDRIKNIFKK